MCACPVDGRPGRRCRRVDAKTDVCLIEVNVELLAGHLALILYRTRGGLDGRLNMFLLLIEIRGDFDQNNTSQFLGDAHDRNL